MSLWQQMFEPAREVQYTQDEFNTAWNWIFERDTAGNYLRASLTLSIIRTKSLALRKAGIDGDTAKMATVDVWRNQTQIKAHSVPPRKIVRNL